MDVFTQKKWLTIGVVALIAINLFSLGAMWVQQQSISSLAGQDQHRRSGKHQGPAGPTEELSQTLGFTEAQQQTADSLRKHKRQLDDENRQKMRLLNDSMMVQFKSKNPDVAEMNRLSERMGELEVRFRTIGVEHFLAMRELCTEDQREKFQELFFEMRRRFGPPPPRGPGGHGARPHGRPPNH